MYSSAELNATYADSLSAVVCVCVCVCMCVRVCVRAGLSLCVHSMPEEHNNSALHALIRIIAQNKNNKNKNNI
jgi:hypothetical protein